MAISVDMRVLMILPKSPSTMQFRGPPFRHGLCLAPIGADACLAPTTNRTSTNWRQMAAAPVGASPIAGRQMAPLAGTGQPEMQVRAGLYQSCNARRRMKGLFLSCPLRPVQPSRRKERLLERSRRQLIRLVRSFAVLTATHKQQYSR